MTVDDRLGVVMIGRWRRLSIRTRLTIWYVALLAGTLIGLITLGIWLLRLELYGTADDLLRTKSAAVVSEVDVSKKGLSFATDGIQGAEPPLVVRGLDLVEVWGLDRRSVYHYGTGAVSAGEGTDALNAALQGEERFETTRSDTGERFRLLAQPVIEKGKLVGAVLVGRSTADVDDLLGRMRELGMLGMLFGLLVAWAGGSFLASRALRPVDDVRRAAEQIGAEDLSLRLPTPASEDELGRLTSAFNRMIERLERSFAQQQRFTADASHELRSPLAAIRSLAEVALSSPRDAVYARRVFASICGESERLTHLVESLLVLARADQGQPLTVRSVEVNDILLDAAERVSAVSREQGVHLSVVTADDEQLVGDSDWLTQLLVNLLHNAIRHTPRGGRVTLSAQRTRDAIVLRVADTGDGIAPEHLPRIFDRFYRADAARSRATGGFGLGLAICQWIVKAHHGELTVTSVVGRGTTFEARLVQGHPAPREPASPHEGGSGVPFAATERDTALASGAGPPASC